MLLIILTISLILQHITIVQAAFTPSQSNALTYGTDRFSLDYAKGYFCINSNGKAVGCGSQMGTTFWPGFEMNDLWYTVTNRTRNENIYINHYNGAYMNGKYYDIKEYIWIPDGGEMGIYSLTGGIVGKIANRCIREFHFYEAGTLNSSNPIEVTFRGIAKLTDLDVNEGYTINNINRAYLTNPTNVKYTGNNTWLGTIDNSPNWERDVLWAEVYGSPSNPLTITYWAAGSHGGEINFSTDSLIGKITYNPNGGVGFNIEQIVSLGDENEILNNPYTRTGYTFTGWNTDPNGYGTSYTPGGIYTIHSEMTLYAQWRSNTHNINGSVSWNDQNNKYNSRPSSVNVSLARTPTTGEIIPLPGPKQVSGNANYTFENVQTYDMTTGNAYWYSVSQNQVPGYKTTINGFNIVNDLILPQYTSKIEYNLIDDFRGEYLKNTKVQMTATVEANRTNEGKVGVNHSKATYIIDEGITIDKDTIKITYIDGTTGEKININNFTVEGNTILVEYGVGNNHVTKPGDKLTITVDGEISQIKQHNNSVTLTGNLTDYRGTDTNINLGQVTRAEKNYEVKYQKPVGRMQFEKRDSITEEKITGAIFTLYEWNGSEYVEKETIRDEDGDGIYTTGYYAWNPVTNGKYKIVETQTPENHQDSGFEMEFLIEELHAQDYTTQPNYSNPNHKITYTKKEPDDLDRREGIIENEPYKIKVSIDNRDQETKNQVKGNAVYTIYEWNKELGEYQEYISKIDGNKVEMPRRDDKIYESSQWLYYTPNNEGKYKVVETTAGYGYYGDYDENGQKREYEFNVLDMITTGNYEGQTVENESTIQLKNNDNPTIENKRQETKVIVQLIDKESKSHIPQGDGTFAGAEYEIYAKEEISHADGITTRYKDEPGILYKKDELVKKVTTDENGMIQIEDLECGTYYIKQKTPPKGYLKDENTYEIDLTYGGQEKAQVEAEQICENMVKKQAFQIVKQQFIGNNETSPLANAGFRIYLIKDLSIVREGKIVKNEDGTYTLKDEEAKQDPILTPKANSNGTYKIGDLVDYYYKIRYIEETMQLLGQGKEAYYPYDLKGETTAKNYANHQEGQAIEELITRSSGYVRSPELAYGEYIVIETSVPHNKKAITPFVISIEIDSREAQSLKYVLDPDFKTKLKIYTKDMETKKTILKENAKFVIKNLDTDKLVTYKAWGPEVGSVEYGTYENPYKTGKKGYAITPVELPVGNYELIELNAPEGYVLNGYEGYSENGETKPNAQSSIKFEIGTNQIYYVDSELEGDVMVVEQPNQAQVGTIKITNTGDYYKGMTQEGKVEYEEKGIKEAIFYIIAEEDIQSKDEQTKLYSKGDVIRIVTTNEDGIAYAENLPQGKYIIKQMDKGEGFHQNEEQRTVNVIYGSEEPQKTPVTYYEENYKDETTKLEIELIGKDTKEKLEEIEMELYRKKEDGSEELIQKFTTQKNNFYIERIPVGDYIIRQPEGQEKLYKQGYVTNHDIEIKVEARKDIQKVTIEQPYTKVEIDLNDEGEKVEGTVIQIIDKETGKVVEEFTTSGEENEIIEKLPIGDYIIHIKDVDHDKGYVKGDDKEITIIDTEEIQKIPLIQDYTKVEISLLDIDTKEPVIGGTLVITDKDGKEVSDRWITDGKPHRIDRLPVGEYYLVETEAPTLKGYVRSEKVAFRVEETGEIQKVEMLQDYTRVQITPKDEQTNETIKEVEIIVKDEKGNEVGKISIGENEEDINNILNRLPVGDYTLESTKVPYGYKPIHQTLHVKDKQGLQLNDLKVEREEFDLKVETRIETIYRNGKIEYEYKEGDTGTKKIDIKDKKIGTEQIEVKYKIKVSNHKKITGQVGKIEVIIPAGMVFIQSNNKTYWKEENGKVVTEDLRGRDIRQGECAEAELVLNWKNGLENFGTKAIQVEIKEVTSDIGFQETNLENNKAVSEEIIIGVSTGEMNLVYMCWILLGILILAEIYLSKKTKIKKFSIKDKTIQKKK